MTEYAHIVITGASSGIGEALARHYADAGVMLSLTGRHAERLQSVAKACEAMGASVQVAVLDVRDEAAMREWLLARDEQRPVDLVIANAGISSGTGGDPLGEEITQAKALFAVNWDGVLNTVHPLLPRMVARGAGQIALVSSLAGLQGWPSAPAYCASKAAVRLYGESLRMNLHRAGVRVNAICPGFVTSRMTDANDYPMPFIISAEKAAKIIAKGLQNNKKFICFPWPAHMLARLFAALPDGVLLRFLTKLPAKPYIGEE